MNEYLIIVREIGNNNNKFNQLKANIQQYSQIRSEDEYGNVTITYSFTSLNVDVMILFVRSSLNIKASILC